MSPKEQAALPPGWVWGTIGDVSEYVNRGRAPKYTGQSGVPIINQRCIRWSGVNYEFIKYTTAESVSKLANEQLLRDGDLLWNSTGTGTIGRAAIFHAEIERPQVVVDTHVTIVRPKAYEPELLKYWIYSDAVQRKMSEMQSGSTNQVELSRKAVVSTPLPIPPANEQKRIVTKIDELFSQIDEGERNLKRVQALLKQYRQSVLKAAVTGELTKDWRAKNVGKGETGADLLKRILVARREAWEAAELAKLKAKGKAPKNDDWKKKYVEPAAPDAANLPELADGWVWATGEQLFEWSSGDFLPASKMCPGEVPVYGGNGISGWHDTAFVKHQTIVIGRVGAHCGNVHLVSPPAWITDNAIYATKTATDVELSYMALCLTHARLGTVSQGGAQPFVNQAALKECAIPLPPFAEQQAIVDMHFAQLSQMDRLAEDVEKFARAAASARQAILRSAFSGQLVPQDSSDEPASELLKRIAAADAADVEDQEAVPPTRGRRKKNKESVAA